MTSEGAGILIVEDEPELVRALRINVPGICSPNPGMGYRYQL